MFWFELMLMYSFFDGNMIKVFTDERQIYSDVARATKGKHQKGEKIL